jgi:hypothetical protein
MRDRACIRLDVTTRRLAWLFWVLAAACIIANLTSHTYDLGFVGVFFVGAGATTHVRTFICEHDRNATAAFELGRDVGRSEGQPDLPLQRIR